MAGHGGSRIRTGLEYGSGDLLYLIRNDTTANVAWQLRLPKPAGWIHMLDLRAHRRSEVTPRVIEQLELEKDPDSGVKNQI
jgi:hypothetical protein